MAFIGHHSGGMIFVISSSYCQGNQLLTGKINYQTGNEANWFFLKNLRQRKAYTISSNSFVKTPVKRRRVGKAVCSVPALLTLTETSGSGSYEISKVSAARLW